MLVIPALDLLGGRNARGGLGHYAGEPAAILRQFALEGAKLVHLVDLDAAYGRREDNTRLIRELLRIRIVDVEVGGNLRDPVKVREFLEAGARHIVIGQLALEFPAAAEALIREFGDGIVGGIDALDGQVAYRGGGFRHEINPVELAKEMADWGIRRVVVADARRDGMLMGANLELAMAISMETGLEVTGSGGISSLDEIRGARRLHSLIVGRALYEGVFTLREAVAAAGES
jgi:phosphoribosylformimino-5-aminoimidazole carboxamide ribonucleotide (ProFAR) isomerase